MNNSNLKQAKEKKKKKKLGFPDISHRQIIVNRRITVEASRAHTVEAAAFVFSVSRKRTISSLRSVSTAPELSLVTQSVFRGRLINKCGEFRRVYAQGLRAESRIDLCVDLYRRRVCQNCARRPRSTLDHDGKRERHVHMLFSGWSIYLN